MDCLVSIIIPIYNMESYLQRCLDSIYASTYGNLEIICVNDGSTDNSLAILKQQTDQRIRIVDKPNGGVSSARNAGLDVAYGEYIAFVDPDDWIHPCFVEWLMEGIRGGGYDVAIGGFSYSTRVEDFDYTCEEVKPCTVEDYCNSKCFRSVWGKIYSRSSIGTILFDKSLIYGEDTLFNYLVCFSNNRKCCFLDKSLYFYFERSDSASKTFCEKEYLNLSNKMMQYLESNWFDNNTAGIVARKIIADICNYRYISSVKYGIDLKRKVRCWKLLFHVWKVIIEKKIRFNQKIQYFILSVSGFAYRSYRNYTDPSLIRWERQTKTKKGN